MITWILISILPVKICQVYLGTNNMIINTKCYIAKGKTHWMHLINHDWILLAGYDGEMALISAVKDV
jgi:hypothetical protein